ncbi:MULTISPECIES: electron transfer flavoprotein subunit alpha/FixB family protein [Arthrobacter]|uniref:Electron transfer flavoprotein subunit alpha/FixB family protein n=2 Tax=Arthrobacter TaxID=1663 RepID=A0ABU9KLU4_9MICC|nr:electron transfer flavoprotein subunit alpha/FixB family protein [Arthrobacter sp. YJM1]MDP5227201.1 electron transfer flavoprotein subunit alpha/FixB family protein [Arthrobacter sp. YJM1]
MTNVLVVITSPDGTLKKNQQELLTLGRSLGDVSVALTGDASAAAAAAAYGASVSYTAPESLGSYGASAQAAFVAEAVSRSGAATVLLENTVAAKETAAILGVKLGAGVVTDVVSLAADGAATKSVLAGAYTTVARSRGAVAVHTVKSHAVEPSEAPVEGRVEAVELPESAFATAARVLSREAKPKSGRPELSEARIIVAGGRGVDGDFGPVEELADLLGAAVGASRVATDNGWIGHDSQVGQTGVVVSPQLYISAGISGAIQQKAGMQTSRVIVAINSDEDAPVFEIADFGIVGDLFQVLPQASEELRRRKG